MKFLSWFLVIFLALTQSVYAQSVGSSGRVSVINTPTVTVGTTTGNVPVVPTGVAQASITNTTTSIPNTDTTVTLATASRHIIIKTEADSAVLYLDLAGGTATTADFRISPNQAVTYEGIAISSFHILGASATGTYSVLAW